MGRSSIDAAPQPSNATWSQAGYPGEIPYSKDNVINVKDAGAVGDGENPGYQRQYPDHRSPLAHRLYLSKNPIIRPIRYVEQVGIEDLHLKRLDSGSEGGNNISMTRTADCWIRRVESEWTEKYHITVNGTPDKRKDTQEHKLLCPPTRGYATFFA